MPAIQSKSEYAFNRYVEEKSKVKKTDETINSLEKELNNFSNDIDAAKNSYLFREEVEPGRVEEDNARGSISRLRHGQVRNQAERSAYAAALGGSIGASQDIIRSRERQIKRGQQRQRSAFITAANSFRKDINDIKEKAQSNADAFFFDAHTYKEKENKEIVEKLESRISNLSDEGEVNLGTLTIGDAEKYAKNFGVSSEQFFTALSTVKKSELDVLKKLGSEYDIGETDILNAYRDNGAEAVRELISKEQELDRLNDNEFNRLKILGEEQDFEKGKISIQNAKLDTQIKKQKLEQDKLKFIKNKESSKRKYPVLEVLNTATPITEYINAVASSKEGANTLKLVAERAAESVITKENKDIADIEKLYDAGVDEFGVGQIIEELASLPQDSIEKLPQEVQQALQQLSRISVANNLEDLQKIAVYNALDNVEFESIYKTNFGKKQGGNVTNFFSNIGVDEADENLKHNKIIEKRKEGLKNVIFGENVEIPSIISQEKGKAMIDEILSIIQEYKFKSEIEGESSIKKEYNLWKTR